MIALMVLLRRHRLSDREIVDCWQGRGTACQPALPLGCALDLQPRGRSRADLVPLGECGRARHSPGGTVVEDGFWHQKYRGKSRRGAAALCHNHMPSAWAGGVRGRVALLVSWQNQPASAGSFRDSVNAYQSSPLLSESLMKYNYERMSDTFNQSSW